MTDTAATDVDLLARLDLPAKVALLTGATTFTLVPEAALGLGEVALSDGPTGVRGLQFSGGRKVALFPNATLLAASWSTERLGEVGRLLAEEALAQSIHVVLGPTINLHRSPLGGRLFEAFSEDPLLSGHLAAAYVRGMQASGVGACLKHLVANESETERSTVDSVVDEAVLRELYLLPFEIAVADSDPWSIMAAYNDVNGVPATEQVHVITEVVKGEWGYRGLVMSDWFATKSAGPAKSAGLDLVMPGPDGPWGDALLRAVADGSCPEAAVDDSVRRLLLLAERVGALDGGRDRPTGLPAPDSAVRREQLTGLAAAGMTLLTDRSGLLPLAPGLSVALIGRHAVETVDMGGGSARVDPPYQTSVAQGLGELLGDAVTVTDGVEVRNRPVPAKAGVLTDPVTGQPGFRALLYGDDGSLLEDRPVTAATTVVGFDDGLAGQVHTLVLRARVALTGLVEAGVIGVGDWDWRLAGRTEQAELRVGGASLGEELLVPPFSLATVELPDAAAEPDAGVLEATCRLAGGERRGLYALVARTAPRAGSEVVAEAVAAARTAEVSVVVVGLTDEQETEAADKATLALPGGQDDLVRAVAAASTRTVVVVNAATPVLMPWLEEVDAVLWVGLPGQEGGRAVARVLTGALEPTGRLVTSFPAADGLAPAWSVTPVDGRLDYSEGLFIGYRGHDAGLAPAPLFWFGHGLGYSSWDYSAAAVVDGTPPGVRVTVRNAGSRDSREVVQVYLRPGDPAAPVRLVGWRTVEVAAGDAVEVEVATDARMWRRWDSARDRWGALPSGGTLLVARGLGDIRAELPL